MGLRIWQGIDTLLNSVDELIEQQLDLALPSHGPTIRNPQTQLDQYRTKLTTFRQSYIRGYPVFESTEQDRDSISKPTAVPLISQVTPHLYKLSHKTKGKNFAIFDPYWVSAYPYRVDFSERDEQHVTVTVRNHRDSQQQHRIELKLPPGVTAEPSILRDQIDRKSRRSYRVKLNMDSSTAAPGVNIVPFDITLDSNHYGELFDFLIRVPD